MSVDIAANLAAVRRRMATAATEAGRHPSEIDLVAVSKTHPASRVELALQAGQRVFGENRVQEAAGKYPELRTRFPDLRLHLIGSLQTNKTLEAVRLFDAIETVDRPKLATALAAAMEKSGRRPDCYIQVNTGEEFQKGGVAPDGVKALLQVCRDDCALPVVGLMCIPPLDQPPAPYFALLRELARRHDLQRLSMGMSADYDAAIRLGATSVRIGTAIFGVRDAA